MRILIIRHGDPDYEKDSLTQKGWHEAELLADKSSAVRGILCRRFSLKRTTFTM